ncbi:MAG: hypothetical protein QNJ45_02940 [Ardenticatenaceae bacterium]|nr:hypothetical protein [Ardenticatenaceae bacterium]
MKLSRLSSLVSRLWSLVSGLILLTLAACQGLVPTPPRLANQDAPPPPTPTQVILTVPDSTGEPIAAPPELIEQVDPNPVVTLWVNETSAEHRETLTTMQQDLIEQHGIYLEFILVEQSRLPDLVETAVLSGTLPDLILHPVEFTAGWVERGILNPSAADQLVEELNPETFEPLALELVQVENQTAAVPSDGWPQLTIYRQDWFNTLNLDPPDSYANILDAASQIYRSETLSAQTSISSSLISGLVIPTESGLVATHHVFEYWALANNCNLIDEKGEILILHPDCLAALDFYRLAINSYSPSDIQTDISAVNAYLAGRTGMITTDPETLVLLAGLDNQLVPICPECQDNAQFLAQNTGIVTRLSGGEADPIAFSHYTYLGVTQQADPDLSKTVINYWLNEGYETWLAEEPERKIPLRLGTPADPQQFRSSWQELPLRPNGPTLVDAYGEETVAQMTAAIANSSRWGFSEGYGALVTNIHEEFTMSIVLQEMLSGYFTSSQAIIEGYQRIVDLIPDYAYYIEPAPPDETPEPADDSG